MTISLLFPWRHRTHDTRVFWPSFSIHLFAGFHQDKRDTMALQGHCLCGGVRVTIPKDQLPLTVMACHCYNCRTTAGSTLSLVTPVSLDKIDLQSEDLGKYVDKQTKSGNQVTRHFCRSCGTPVFTQAGSMTVLKMGLFSGQTNFAKPVAEIFWANHEEWESPVPESNLSDYAPE